MTRPAGPAHSRAARAVIACALALTVISGCLKSPGSGGDDAKVKLGETSATLSSANRLVASSMQTYQKNGLEPAGESVSFNGSSPNMISAVISGSVDFGYGGTTTMVDSIQSGAPITVVAAVSTNMTELVLRKQVAEKLAPVTAKSPLEKRVKAIKGLTIATAPSASTNNVMLQALARQYGLDPGRDLDIVPAEPRAIVAGIRAGKFDGGFWTAGVLEENVIAGDGVKWVDLAGEDVPGLSDLMTGGIVAKRSTVEQNPELVDKYLASLRDAADLVEKDEASARAAVKKQYFPDLDQKVYDLTWKNSRPAFNDDARISESEFEALLDFQAEQFPDKDYSKVEYSKAVYRGAQEKTG